LILGEEFTKLELVDMNYSDHFSSALNYFLRYFQHAWEIWFNDKRQYYSYRFQVLFI